MLICTDTPLSQKAWTCNQHKRKLQERVRGCLKSRINLQHSRDENSAFTDQWHAWLKQIYCWFWKSLSTNTLGKIIPKECCHIKNHYVEIIVFTKSVMKQNVSHQKALSLFIARCFSFTCYDGTQQTETSQETQLPSEHLHTKPHDSGWKVSYSIPSVLKQSFWLFTVYVLCLLAGQGWGCGAEAAAETRLVATAAEKGSNSVSLCPCLNLPKLSLILIVLLKTGATWNSLQVLSLQRETFNFAYKYSEPFWLHAAKVTHIHSVHTMIPFTHPTAMPAFL